MTNLTRGVGIAIAAVAGLRLSRFITTDSLGDWLIQRPAKRWALTPHAKQVREAFGETDAANDTPLEEHFDKIEGVTDLGWRAKLVSGLQCPFCVGFWTMLTALGANEIVAGDRRTAPAKRVTSTVLTALAANYAAGHLSSRIDS